MATSILTPPASYTLKQEDRQKILEQADNPLGRISQGKLQEIERQRAAFTLLNGNSF